MLEFLQYDFMQRALLAGVIISITAPLIGQFLVVKRYSLVADTLAHISLLGVALGVLAGVSPLFGALLLSMLAAVIIEILRPSGGSYPESLLALFLSGSLALSVLLFRFAQVSINVSAVLFGSISTVTQQDILLMLGVGLVVAFFIIANYQKLFFISWNEELAEATGINTRAFQFMLMLLSGAVIGVSIRVVGVLLISALMVIPVLASLTFKNGFSKTLIRSTGLSLLCTMSGIILAYYIGTPAGATIVVVALGCYIVCYLISRLNKK